MGGKLLYDSLKCCRLVVEGWLINRDFIKS